MTVRYRVDIENHSGVAVASFKDFLSLDVEIKIGDKGDYQLALSGFDERVALIQDDYLMRVWMTDPAYGIPWKNVFTGIHKTVVDNFFSNGRKTWVSYGPACEEILDKESIAYPSGVPQSKIDPSAGTPVSTVMYRFVRENVGDLATVANGRFYDAVNPVVLGTDLGQGPSWTGSRAQKPLLGVLQELRQYSIEEGDQVDFQMNYIGGYQFEFRAGKIFADRTTDGLTASSNGLNAAGNAPVIFAPQYGNVSSATRSKSRYAEINLVVALGQGVGQKRKYAVVKNPGSIAASPIAQRAVMVNATNQQLEEELIAVGVARLDENKAEEKYRFEARRGAQVLWRDYFPGDFVTVEDFRTGERFNRQLVGVSLKVDGDGQQVEDIRMRFEDA